MPCVQAHTGIESANRNTALTHMALLANARETGVLYPETAQSTDIVNKLGIAYEIHSEVVDYLKTVEGFVEDFVCYFDGLAQDVNNIVAQDRPLDHRGDDNFLDKGIAAPRIQQDRTGIRKESAGLNMVHRPEDEAVLSEPLPVGAIQFLKQVHWRRHKIRFPADIMCADMLISRLARELNKRALQVYPMSEVCTLTHQNTSHAKKRKLDTDRYTSRTSGQVAALDYESYLDQLFTYLLALSHAGSNWRPQRPRRGETAHQSCFYVEIPFNLLQRYYWRARRASRMQPVKNRLAWLRAQDIAERSRWTEEYNSSTCSLGIIIWSIMRQRDVQWYPRSSRQKLGHGMVNLPRTNLSSFISTQGSGGGIPPGGSNGDKEEQGKHKKNLSGRKRAPDETYGGNDRQDKRRTGPERKRRWLDNRARVTHNDRTSQDNVFGGPVSFKMKDGKAVSQNFQKGTCTSMTDTSAMCLHPTDQHSNGPVGCKDGLRRCAIITNKQGTRVCGMNHPAWAHRWT